MKEGGREGGLEGRREGGREASSLNKLFSVYVIMQVIRLLLSTVCMPRSLKTAYVGLCGHTV